MLDEGWVMVAVESKAKAQKAVKSLKVIGLVERSALSNYTHVFRAKLEVKLESH